MGVKLTYKFVKQSFENEGYTLVSKEYINAQTKLYYRCSKNHEHSIVWGSWQSGERCPHCSNNAKISIYKIIEMFSNENYTLLSKKYNNAKTKLDYKCPNGHEHSISWDSWRQGKRCLSCCRNAKPTIEQVRNSFNKDGYTLLSNKYISSKTKLDYKCSCNHEHNMRWNDWQQGNRCPTCANIKISGSGCHLWKGGISYEPYCPIWKDKEYKADIRERDGNKCLNPACTKKDVVLHIHHIDYNKKNCSPSNLITVCRSCNTSANKDRDWHTTWYSAIIKNRYYSRSV